MPTERSIGLTPAEAKAIDRALGMAVAHLIAMADDTPYPDDPRWSPWTRFQEPLAERCRLARNALREALNAH